MNEKGVELSLFLWVQLRGTFPLPQGCLDLTQSGGNALLGTVSLALCAVT